MHMMSVHALGKLWGSGAVKDDGWRVTAPWADTKVSVFDTCGNIILARMRVIWEAKASGG